VAVVAAADGGGTAGGTGREGGGVLRGLLAEKILCDIPCLSQNEAYAGLGLSELSHSDQIPTSNAAPGQQNPIATSADGRGIRVI